jgi:hypothetical protein
VHCRTCFDWQTLRIITNQTIHNPHYYEYLRQQNGGVAPRNANDVPCGGLVGSVELERALRTRGCLPRYSIPLLEFHRQIRRIQRYGLQQLPPADVLIRPRDNADLRLKYLLKRIDRNEWKKQLVEREKKQQMQLALRHVYECFVGVSSELYRRFMIQTTMSSKDALKEMQSLQEFTNEALRGISNRFQCTVRCIACIS